MKRVTIDNKEYQRDCDVVGEVEMIKWFLVTKNGLSEVLGDEALSNLELKYEAMLMCELIPETFYI